MKMPRKSPRRPRSIIDVRDLELVLSAADKRNLEAALHSKIDDSHFTELHLIVRSYFLEVIAGRGETWAKHLSHLSKIKDVAASLKSLLEHAENPEISEPATSALNQDLNENLGGDGSLFVPRYRVFADVSEYEDYARDCTYPLNDYATENSLPPLRQGSSMVALQISDISLMLTLLQNSADRVRRDYANEASGIVSKSAAFDKLLVKVYEWAKRCQFETSMMRKDQSAGPLALFAFELIRIFPENVRPNPASAEAVAKAIQRARAAVGQKRKQGSLKMSSPG